MKNLNQIEAAAASLPPDQQRELLTWLTQRGDRSQPKSRSVSVTQIPAVDVGDFLSLDDNGDLLDEMLERRI